MAINVLAKPFQSLADLAFLDWLLERSQIVDLGGFYALGFHVEFGDLSSSLEETLAGVFGSVELIG